ncbi:MAG: LLM class flavin-dependent oxidoreductase [Dehalococcoidia bacterium]|nr:LLM class flavin-dependent oxidoreductase [Dehalococcoidia bacterium]MCB9486126.1 LLM class flavin-dependent oxidoreductase [Thermoflexaceae bacterium]
MKVAIGIGVVNDDFESVGTYVREAEKLGVDAVWSAESWGHDAVTPLAYLAAQTSKILLGSGIMQISGRTPAMTAMTALTLATMSHDRFLMGFGASGPQVVEGWHGQQFGSTVQRLREYIEIVRLAVSGAKVEYDGEIFHLPRPGGEGKAIRSAAKPRSVPIPIYLATLSPKSLELTGEVADGWVGTSFMPAHADVFFTHMRRGAERAGRDWASIDRMAGGSVEFGDDIEKLIAPRKPGLAFTLGAMGSRRHNFYNQAFQRAGFEDVGKEAQRLYLDGRRAEAAALVPDEMVVGANLLGTEAMVKDRVRAYRDSGVTTLRVDPQGEGLAGKLDTLGRVVSLVHAVNAESA